jgi:hypothetical protein
MQDAYATMIEGWRSQVARIDEELLAATQAINADAARRISEMYANHAERRSRLFAAIALSEIPADTLQPQWSSVVESRREPARSVILRTLSEANGEVSLSDVKKAVKAVGWTVDAARKSIMRLETEGLLVKANRMLRLTAAGQEKMKGSRPAKETTSACNPPEDREEILPEPVEKLSKDEAELNRRQSDKVFGKSHPFWNVVSAYARLKVRDGGSPLPAKDIAAMIRERHSFFEVDGRSVPNRLLGMGFRRVFDLSTGKASYWIGDGIPEGYR